MPLHRTVGKSLKHVSDVQNARASRGLGMDILLRVPRVPELQAPHTVLEQERKGAPVLVRRQAACDALGQLLGLDGRVVGQTQLVVLARVQLLHVRAVRVAQLERQAQRVEDPHGGAMHVPVQAEGEVTIPGQRGLGEPDVGLRGVLLAADLVAFLFGSVEAAPTGSPCVL